MICRLCEKVDGENQGVGVCAACAKAGAIVALPPSTRPPRPCRSCEGNTFVRAIPREFIHGRAVPMTAVQKASTFEFFGVHTQPPDPAQGWGLLEMFICRSCEAVEWYCHGAATLPIGPEYNTELVEIPTGGAYRSPTSGGGSNS